MTEPIVLEPTQSHCLVCGARYREVLVECALCASRGDEATALDRLHVAEAPLGLANDGDREYALVDRHGRAVRWEYDVDPDGVLRGEDGRPLELAPPGPPRATTRRGVVLTTEQTKAGTEVRVRDPQAPAEFADYFMGRIIQGAFQPRPFSATGLTPDALRALADLIDLVVDQEGGAAPRRGLALPPALAGLRPGDRIRTTAPLPRDPSSPPVGSTATVVAVREEVGQVDVEWDHRCSLILLTTDPFTTIDADQEGAP